MSNFVIYITGFMSACIAYALFMDGVDEEPEEVVEENGLTVHTHLGRLMEIYCQTCRKLKRHRELEEYLFECTKCKRRIDLRRAS